MIQLVKNSNYEFSSIRLLTSLKTLPNKTPGIICDIGCRDGRFAKLLEQRFPSIDKIILIDISASNIHRARSLCRRTPERFEYIIADARYLPLRDAHVDTCVLLEVIEHLIPLEGSRVLKEVNRIIRDSGLILFSTPNKNSITSITGRILFPFLGLKWTTGDQSHAHIYSMNEILGLLKKEGFRILQKRGFYILPAGLHEIDKKLGNNKLYGIALSKMVFRSRRRFKKEACRSYREKEW